MKVSWILVFLLSLLFFAGPASNMVNYHEGITKYEGTKTCLECHANAAKEVATSLHYQQQAQARFLKDWPADKPVGMMVSF